jgi:hypothetical protein
MFGRPAATGYTIDPVRRALFIAMRAVLKTCTRLALRVGMGAAGTAWVFELEPAVLLGFAIIGQSTFACFEIEKSSFDGRITVPTRQDRRK